MTTGEKLLKLTAEYVDAENRAGWGDLGGDARPKVEIVAEYEPALRDFLKG